MIDVRPEKTDEILMNPGVGWQLLVHGAPRDEMERFPLVSTFYYRSGWTAYEPERGRYADSPAVRAIDTWLAEAARHGRYVGIRVVPYNSRNPGFQRRHSQKVAGCDSVIPPYVFEEGAKGFPEPGGSGGWVPVFWDPVYLRCHRELVKFLGERYAGHPNLAYVDVPAGNYGEMNLTNTEVPELDDLSTWKEFGLRAESWSGMLRELCDMYREHFPGDLLVAARDYSYYDGGPEGLTYAVAKGVGFRDDGLGMSYCGPGQTNPEYEQHWREVLCLYENGFGNWLDWGDEASVRATLEWAIDRTHASIIMAGKERRSIRSYEKFLPLVEDHGKRLGYRLVVEEASWPDSVGAGDDLDVSLLWRNLGSAPPYQSFALEVALLTPAEAIACSHVIPPDALGSAEWLPGEDIPRAISIPLPADLPTGRYSVAVSLVEPLPRQAAEEPIEVRRRIALGIRGGGDDRRYSLGELTVE
jgi:hypothetical protein